MSTTVTKEQRYSSVKEVRERLIGYFGEEEGEAEEFDAKKIGEDLEDKFYDMCERLELPFRVTLLECTDNLYVLVLSEYALFEGVSTNVLKKRFRQEYVEIRMRSLTQRTFVLQAENKKAGWAVFTELYQFKYYKRVAWVHELLGVKRRKMFIAPIVFCAASDGQVDIIEDTFRKTDKRPLPSRKDVETAASVYDVTLSEEVIGINKLLVKEVIRYETEEEQSDNMIAARNKGIVSRALRDAILTGEMGGEGRLAGIVNLFSNNAVKMILGFLGIMMLVYLLNLVLALGLGWPMLFPGGPLDGNTTTPYTGGPAPYTGP